MACGALGRSRNCRRVHLRSVRGGSDEPPASAGANDAALAMLCTDVSPAASRISPSASNSSDPTSDPEPLTERESSGCCESSACWALALSDAAARIDSAALSRELRSFLRSVYHGKWLNMPPAARPAAPEPSAGTAAAASPNTERAAPDQQAVSASALAEREPDALLRNSQSADWEIVRLAGRSNGGLASRSLHTVSVKV